MKIPETWLRKFRSIKKNMKIFISFFTLLIYGNNQFHSIFIKDILMIFSLVFRIKHVRLETISLFYSKRIIFYFFKRRYV